MFGDLTARAPVLLIVASFTSLIQSTLMRIDVASGTPTGGEILDRATVVMTTQTLGIGMGAD